MATVIHIDNASKSKKAKKAKKSKSKWSRDEDGHAPSEDGHPTSNGDARSVYETLEAGRRAHCYEGKPFSDYNGYSSTATDTFRRTTNKTVLFQDRKQSSDDKGASEQNWAGRCCKVTWSYGMCILIGCLSLVAVGGIICAAVAFYYTHMYIAEMNVRDLGFSPAMNLPTSKVYLQYQDRICDTIGDNFQGELKSCEVDAFISDSKNVSTIAYIRLLIWKRKLRSLRPLANRYIVKRLQIISNDIFLDLMSLHIAPEKLYFEVISRVPYAAVDLDIKNSTEFSDAENYISEKLKSVIDVDNCFVESFTKSGSNLDVLTKISLDHDRLRTKTLEEISLSSGTFGSDNMADYLKRHLTASDVILDNNYFGTADLTTEAIRPDDFSFWRYQRIY